MFHAVIVYLCSFVVIYLLNFPVTELFSPCYLLVTLFSLCLWASFHVVLRSAGPCVTLGNTVVLYSE